MDDLNCIEVKFENMLILNGLDHSCVNSSSGLLFHKIMKIHIEYCKKISKFLEFFFKKLLVLKVLNNYCTKSISFHKVEQMCL